MEKLNKETIKRISNFPGIYYIIKTFEIDSITGIWKNFNKNKT